MPRATGDAAGTDRLAVVILLAMLILVTGAVWGWMRYVNAPPPPATLVLEPLGPMDEKGVRTYRVVNASEHLNWSKVVLEIDGKRLTYDDLLSNPLRYCVAPVGASCASDVIWGHADTPVHEGQLVKVHAPTSTGKDFAALDRPSGTQLYVDKLQ